MRAPAGTATVAAILSIALSAAAQGQRKVEFEITPAIQHELDVWKGRAAELAAEPAIVAAVEKANQKGPIAKLDNKAWKKLSRNDKRVLALRLNPVGRRLKAFLLAGKGAISEAFLNGDRGHKVGFVSKTSSYLHRGKAKFDVPFKTGKAWQGKPEADKSTHTYQIQLSVPVFEPAPTEPADEGKGKPAPEGHGAGKRRAIGVLVIGVELSHLARVAARPSK